MISNYLRTTISQADEGLNPAITTGIRYLIMNRRNFLQTSVAATVGFTFDSLTANDISNLKPPSRLQTKIAAYYLRAHMYTCVPRQIRDDMKWMGEQGTNYVCVAVLEQDFFAGYENLALIIKEAERSGMQVIAVPSRWAGLTAGAPKVPSLFTILNPQTWIVNKNGSTFIMPRTCGAISSVHHPDTLKFFFDTLTEMYQQHPSLAGFIIDEPKGFIFDQSPAAIAAIGKNATTSAYYLGAQNFYSKVCAFAKEHWPNKLTILFQEANKLQEEIAAGAGVSHLDYYGCDGRPWTMEDDIKMRNNDENQESGKGKILLSGRGEMFIKEARNINNRKAFLLAENHNLKANMIESMDRNYADVLKLGADMFTYYYYPRNVDNAEEAMEIIRRHLSRFTRASQ
ncbi:MAG TPA: hypothetical protein VHG71_03510 [Verrucomicrobiae bacterium]|nr:hypothetical protein [Verrucomicrobiae bacterium]